MTPTARYAPAVGHDGQHETFEGALDVSLELPLAHAGTRAVAQAVDLMVVSLLVMVVFLVVLGGAVGLTASAVDNETVFALAMAGLIIFSFLAQWGYFVGCEQLMEGQSPGKAVMGIRVVGRDGAVRKVGGEGELSPVDEPSAGALLGSLELEHERRRAARTAAHPPARAVARVRADAGRGPPRAP